MDRNNHNASYRTGTLPMDAPLAAAYVPMQRSADPAYESLDALSKGTLFPGLDLPFMNVINKTLPSTMLTELMAIDFVLDDLQLYLDTHSEDREAFEMYQTFLALKKEAKQRYVKMCGPITQCDMLGMNEYAWLNNPWPWEFQPKMEV